jgi:hypothetical protein
MIKERLKKYILEAVKEAALQAVTKENLQAILQYVVDRLLEESLKTENTVDDWIVNLLAGWVTDANVEKMFTFLQSCLGIDHGRVYGVDRYSMHDYTASLAEKMAPDGVTYASPTLTQVYNILLIIIPILYDWFTKTGDKDSE